jgi:hypothetical protein
MVEVGRRRNSDAGDIPPLQPRLYDLDRSWPIPPRWLHLMGARHHFAIFQRLNQPIGAHLHDSNARQELPALI